MASAGNHRYAKALVFEESSDYNSGESNTLVCQNGILFFNGKQLSSNTGNQFDIFTANKVTRLSGANIQWASNLVVLPHTGTISPSASAGQGFQSDGTFLYYNGVQISAFSNIYQDENPLTSNSITPLGNTSFVVHSNLVVDNVMFANTQTTTIASKTLHFSNNGPQITFNSTDFNIQPVSTGTNVQFLGASGGTGSDCNMNFVSTASDNTVGSDVVNLKFKNKGDSPDATRNHTVATLKVIQSTQFNPSQGGGSMTLTCRNPKDGTDDSDVQNVMLHMNTQSSVANTIVIAPDTLAKVGIMAGYAPGKTFQIGSNGAENLYFDNASNTLALGKFSNIFTPSNVWFQGGGDRVTIGSSTQAGEKSVVIGTPAGNANVVSIGFGHSGILEASIVKIGSYSTTTKENSVSIGHKPKAGNDGVSIGSNTGTLAAQYSVSIGKEAGSVLQSGNAVAIGWLTGQSSQESNSVAIGHNAGNSSQKRSAVAIGYSAGASTQGSFSVAIGINSGKSTQGSRSVAIGPGAGESNQASTAIAIGSNAGIISQYANSIAIGNSSGHSGQNTSAVSIGVDAGYQGQYANSIAIGYKAAKFNQEEVSIAIGDFAGYNLQGPKTVSIGFKAGFSKQDNQAVAIGNEAGENEQGFDSIAIGSGAGSKKQDHHSIAIGALSGANNQNNFAVSIGYTAGQFQQSANAVAIGDHAGYSLQGFKAVSIGHRAGKLSQNNNAVSIGAFAGESYQNVNSVAVGLNAGREGQNVNSVAIGSDAAKSGQQFDCVAIGYNAGNSIQNARAVAIGPFAGKSSQGSHAIAIGFDAGRENQDSNSVAIGSFAGKISQGENSIAIGRNAGFSNQDGGGNGIAIGFEAAYKNQDDNSIAIGTDAGRSNQGANAIAIGRKAGFSNQNSGSVVINGGFSELLAPNAGFYINPVRNDTGNTSTYSLQWSTSTKEVTYDTAKTFVIDHPDDKEKYLVHGCLEGPEGGVYYRGRGEVGTPVKLPDYVPNLIKGEPTIQVTPIYNGSVRILNCSEYDIKTNSFEVFGTEGPFYWTFTAKRCDVNVEPLKAETNVSGDGPYLFTD